MGLTRFSSRRNLTEFARNCLFFISNFLSSCFTSSSSRFCRHNTEYGVQYSIYCTVTLYMYTQYTEYGVQYSIYCTVTLYMYTQYTEYGVQYSIYCTVTLYMYTQYTEYGVQYSILHCHIIHVYTVHRVWCTIQHTALSHYTIHTQYTEYGVQYSILHCHIIQYTHSTQSMVYNTAYCTVTLYMYTQYTSMVYNTAYCTVTSYYLYYSIYVYTLWLSRECTCFRRIISRFLLTTAHNKNRQQNHQSILTHNCTQQEQTTESSVDSYSQLHTTRTDNRIISRFLLTTAHNKNRQQNHQSILTHNCTQQEQTTESSVDSYSQLHTTRTDNNMAHVYDSVSPRINEKGGGGFSGCTECEILSGGLVHVHTPFIV